ncbi:MAG: two component transcriptional regulator winged helix family [Methylocystaceae bacterium]|nr:MAG: two component transcriptional regulator winged helix family [Methylocystaceae bacterium]KAF0211463.1 MAG: two component transcriptional regulator winged helix [Methylocystaceae bacterium]TXT44606.1 MAG: two component transcriptional regulator winged helix family [Methylocystaceae bacterium]
MSLSRILSIAANAPLRAMLVEQFAALGRYALRDGQLGAPGSDWPDAAIVDESHCDLKALCDARARGCRTRVVLIADEPKSPPLGIDAVVTRPIRFAELVALIDSTPARTAVGPYHFEAGELRAPSGARLKLTEKETAILARLARAHGAAVSREALLRDVWGYGPNMSTRTLETHIHRLRRKLEPSPDRPRWLKTERDGYRLAASEEDPAS